MNVLSVKRNLIRDMVQLVATVFPAEIDVVDADLIRVAASGRHRNMIGERTGPGILYRSALQTDRTVVMVREHTDSLCAYCPNRGDCLEVASICHPISSRNGPLGVISAVAFDDHQREFLSSQQGTALELLARMSRWITQDSEPATSAHDLLDTLLHGVEHLGYGLVATSVDGQVRAYSPVVRELIGGPQSIARVLRDAGSPGTNGQNAWPRYVSGKGDQRLQVRTLVSESGSCLYALREDAGARVSGQPGEPLGHSAAIRELKERAIRVAQTDATVLITGETGSGKEVFSRFMHDMSPRSKGPFQVIECTGVPESIFESELFGYSEGTFTGALRRGKPGRLEGGDGGTVFLDEIGDLPISIQPKLLRFLQEKTIQRLGESTPKKLDTRIIAATNKDLRKMLADGKFREDLYFRLNVIVLSVPPLREHSEDIPALAHHFLSRTKSGVSNFSQPALRALCAYDWPGNVRELQNAVEYAATFADRDTVLLGDLPDWLRAGARDAAPSAGGPREAGSLQDIERETIVEALRRFGHSYSDKCRAAQSLGINVATLYRKIRKYSIAQS
jgi:DNA-binding NtrC family response regulator